MTQEERDQILLDLKNNQQRMFNTQEQLVEGQQQLIGRVDKLEEVQNSLVEGQNLLIKRMDNLEAKQDETNDELRRLSETVAKIEHVHGEKIQILLDAVAAHNQRFDSIENRLDIIEAKIDKHEDKIYYLNSKVHAY